MTDINHQEIIDNAIAAYDDAHKHQRKAYYEHYHAEGKADKDPAVIAAREAWDAAKKAYRKSYKAAEAIDADYDYGVSDRIEDSDELARRAAYSDRKHEGMSGKEISEKLIAAKNALDAAQKALDDARLAIPAYKAAHEKNAAATAALKAVVAVINKAVNDAENAKRKAFQELAKILTIAAGEVANKALALGKSLDNDTAHFAALRALEYTETAEKLYATNDNGNTRRLSDHLRPRN